MDLDNVVFRWSEAFTEYTNVKYNYCDDYLDHRQWDFFNQPEVELTEEQFLESYDEFNKYRMWQSLKVYPYTKESLCAVHAMGNEIIYLTSRPRDSEMATLKSIMKNGLPINGILFTEEKAIIASDLGAKIGVDDKPLTIKQYGEVGILPVKFKHNYNLKTSHDKEIGISCMEHLVNIVQKST